MTLLEFKNYNKLLCPTNHLPQHPRLNTKSYYSSPHSYKLIHPFPLLDHIQINIISISHVTSGIKADYPQTSIMVPYIKAVDFKYIKDSIVAVKQESS